MKKHIKAAITIIFIAAICIFGGMNAFAWTSADYAFFIGYKNAPEGTVFADILFKSDPDDKYLLAEGEEPKAVINVRYTDPGSDEVKERSLKLDKDCELAKYDDGYTSFLFRRNLAREYRVFDSDTDLFFDSLGPMNTELSNYYHSFKIAYCDEKGNVLMVTEAYEPEVTDKPTNYYINADGQTLECQLDHGIDVGKGLTIFLIAAVIMQMILYGAVAVIVIVIVILVIRHIRKKRESGQ